jgi:hypothetical protein
VYISFGTSLETNGIALSAAGDSLYAIATVLNGIWKIPITSVLPVSLSQCTFLNAASNPSTSYQSGQLFDGPLVTSLWYSPGAVAIDGNDNLYVMDQWASPKILSGSRYSQSFNYAIRRVSISTSYVTTIAGKYCFVSGIANTDSKPSAACYSDGNGTTAGICKTKSETISSYIAVGKYGDKLFFTDYGNNVVRQVMCGPLQSIVMSYGQCFYNPPTLAPSQAPSVGPTLSPSSGPTTLPSMLTSIVPTVPVRSEFPSSISPNKQDIQYVSSAFAPNALYQMWMNVSFVSGRLGYFAETAGFHSGGVYNGVLGIALDKTEKYGFLTSADGKKVRKLDLKTTQVGLDITRK